MSREALLALVERAVEAGVQWEAYHPGCGYRGAASLAARVLAEFEKGDKP